MDIPVQFEYEGKTYSGILAPVSGGAAKKYYLLIKNRYYGTLWLVPDIKDYTKPQDYATMEYKWRFRSQNGKLDHLETVFIEAAKPYVTD